METTPEIPGKGEIKEVVERYINLAAESLLRGDRAQTRAFVTDGSKIVDRAILRHGVETEGLYRYLAKLWGIGVRVGAGPQGEEIFQSYFDRLNEEEKKEVQEFLDKLGSKG